MSSAFIKQPLKMSLLIPVLSKTPNLLKELTRALPTVTFHEVTDPGKDPHYKHSEIIICDFNLLGPHLYELPNTKWVQGTWAGIDSLMPWVQKNRPLPYQITRFSGDHFGRIMGEYVIANIVNHERNWLQVSDNQKKKLWSRDGKISDYRVISDLTLGILGVGNIGNRIGKALNFLGAKIVALGRRPKLTNESDYSHLSEYHTKDTLGTFLKQCDYVINVLPSTADTNGLLDGDVLVNCADKQTVLINIGRSNVLSESTIIKALERSWLSAVILDVFDVEPLPENSPLWTTQNVFITPHVAGMSRAKDVAQQFRSNLDLYKKNLTLPATVDLVKGY